MLLENVQKLMKIHTTNQAFNTTTYEVLEWNVQKKRRTWPKIKTSDFFFSKKLIGRLTMIKHCDLWTTWSLGINKLSLSTYQVTFITSSMFWKLTKYRPWLNACDGFSSRLFSSCHLELVILENSQFFACYFDK